jgi:hypothetical protein
MVPAPPGPGNSGDSICGSSGDSIRNFQHPADCLLPFPEFPPLRGSWIAYLFCARKVKTDAKLFTMSDFSKHLLNDEPNVGEHGGQYSNPSMGS